MLRLWHTVVRFNGISFSFLKDEASFIKHSFQWQHGNDRTNTVSQQSQPLQTSVTGQQLRFTTINDITNIKTAISDAAKHQSITNCVVTSRRNTKKQAWISNIAAETPSATAVRNISHLRPRMGSRWAWYILTLFILLCQYFTKPPWSAVNIQRSSWLQIIVRTAESWACMHQQETQQQVL